MERASAQRLVVSEQVDGSDNPRKVRPQASAPVLSSGHL